MGTAIHFYKGEYILVLHGTGLIEEITAGSYYILYNNNRKELFCRTKAMIKLFIRKNPW
jgi:hypothetical protein